MIVQDRNGKLEEYLQLLRSMAFELERAAHVVDVGVGDENLLELETEFGEAAMDAADLVAGIDDDGLAGHFVAEDGAVAGQRADGKGFQNHDFIVVPHPLCRPAVHETVALASRPAVAWTSRSTLATYLGAVVGRARRRLQLTLARF